MKEIGKSTSYEVWLFYVAYFRKNTKLVKWIMSKLFVGLRSNFKAKQNFEYSSHIYILKTTKNHFKRI
jgi:hypothetical protein